MKQKTIAVETTTDDELLSDRKVIETEPLRLSQKDTHRVLNLLKAPPKPNAKLRAAARALRKENLELASKTKSG